MNSRFAPNGAGGSILTGQFFSLVCPYMDPPQMKVIMCHILSLGVGTQVYTNKRVLLLFQFFDSVYTLQVRYISVPSYFKPDTKSPAATRLHTQMPT